MKDQFQYQFREHRGGLAESMKTLVTFDTLEKLERYIADYSRDWIQHGSTFSSRFYAYDSRIEWSTYIVLVKETPIGFSNCEVFSEDRFVPQNTEAHIKDTNDTLPRNNT